MKGLKEDPRAKLFELQSLIATLAVDAVESKDTLSSEDTDLRVKDYEERMKSLGVTYLSTGCPDLDKTFFGYRKNDLITIGEGQVPVKVGFCVSLSIHSKKQFLKRRN